MRKLIGKSLSHQASLCPTDVFDPAIYEWCSVRSSTRKIMTSRKKNDEKITVILMTKFVMAETPNTIQIGRSSIVPEGNISD